MSNFFGTVNTHGSAATIEAPVYEGTIAPTGTALMEIATEGVLEGLQLQAALHVADATITYTAVHESASQAEAVLESVIGSTIGKIKEGLKKLWAKMKAWFKSVAKAFQLAFTSGKDFVKKFKKEIEGKRATGFEYEGHIWDITNGNGKVEGAVNALNGIYSQYAGAAPDKEHKYEIEEIKEKILGEVAGKVGVSGSSGDMSDIKEAIAKAYRGEEKVENKEFSRLSKADLIALIENVDKNKKVIDNIEKTVDKQFSETIKQLDKDEAAIHKSPDSDYKSGPNGDNTAASQRAAHAAIAAMRGNVARYIQSLNSALASTAVESIKASAKEAESVLKQFVRFKGVKESLGSEGASAEGTGVLENFFNMAKL